MHLSVGGKPSTAKRLKFRRKTRSFGWTHARQLRCQKRMRCLLLARFAAPEARTRKTRHLRCVPPSCWNRRLHVIKVDNPSTHDAKKIKCLQYIPAAAIPSLHLGQQVSVQPNRSCMFFLQPVGGSRRHRCVQKNRPAAGRFMQRDMFMPRRSTPPVNVSFLPFFACRGKIGGLIWRCRTLRATDA